MFRAVLAAVAAALVVPVSAQAALSFAFDRAQARAGQRVHAYQADSDGNPAGNTYFGSTYLGSPWTGKPGRVLKVRR